MTYEEARAKAQRIADRTGCDALVMKVYDGFSAGLVHDVSDRHKYEIVFPALKGDA